MRRTRLLWRWRSNSLKRPSDILEARIILVAILLLLAGGLTAAIMTGQTAGNNLHEQRQGRTPTTAVLVNDASDRPSGAAYRTGDTKVSVTVRWQDRNGTTHTGTTRVEPDRPAGTKTTVWVDEHGRLTTRPPGPVISAIEAALAGTVAAIGWCGLVLSALYGIHLRLEHHRAQQWEREWAEVGPRWGRRPT
ncbi:Rv1733c family protein [Streptomyces sp. CA-132043]|uniref:Rv1733c family protein n=1 Tax=Streptomyces sp. CA-132043 TaxID=3240048 RepID=UPI003D8BA88D